MSGIKSKQSSSPKSGGKDIKDESLGEFWDIIWKLREAGKLMHGDQFSVAQITEALNARRGLTNGSQYAFNNTSVGQKLTVLGFRKSGRIRSISYYFVDDAKTRLRGLFG